MDLFVGVDGGGTHTRLAVASADGSERGRAVVGATSLTRRSIAAVRAELVDGLAAVLSSAGGGSEDCVALAAGFASAGSAQNRLVYEELLGAIVPRARVQVTSDIEIAWRGATGGGDGIVVLAGTGSAAFGRYGGATARAGGLGPPEDVGSADWMGRQAVAAGLAPPPAGDDYAGLVPQLVGHAGMVPIWQRAGAELAGLLAECAQRLGWENPEAFAVGGVFDHIPEVGAALRAQWPHALYRARATALAAAVNMALEG